MDVRDSANPVLGHARRWLDQVNPWSRNEHFHGWILRNLPARCRVAVDVGCGMGVLAGKLAPHFAHVTGIDADEAMAGRPARPGRDYISNALTVVRWPESDQLSDYRSFCWFSSFTRPPVIRFGS